MEITITIIVLVFGIWLYSRVRENQRADNMQDEVEQSTPKSVENLHREIKTYSDNELNILENEVSTKLCTLIEETNIAPDDMATYSIKKIHFKLGYLNEELETISLEKISLEILKIGLFRTGNNNIIIHYLENKDFMRKYSDELINDINYKIENKSFFDEPNILFETVTEGKYHNNRYLNTEEVNSFVQGWIIKFKDDIKANFKSYVSTVNQLLLETQNGNKLLEKLADEGDIDSQYNLATLHFKNNNFSMAKYWFEKAAENGEKESQYQLGNMYLQGIGLKKDLSKAFYWYKEAALKNHEKAQHNLGIFYIQGEIVKQNEQEAISWFKKSANNGYEPAKEILNKLL